LRRVCVGGLAGDSEGRFADILMADVLTSYAKPVADLWVVGCSAFGGGGKGVDRACGGGWIVPGLIAVPFL
jgi:predicted oxidoreductase